MPLPIMERLLETLETTFFRGTRQIRAMTPELVVART
jgi:hypothetical protein